MPRVYEDAPTIEMHAGGWAQRDATGRNRERPGPAQTLAAAGGHTQAELAELFDVSRTTVYRGLRRAQPEE